MSRPKSVKVGHLTFTVEYLKKDWSDESVVGQTFKGQQKILIKAGNEHGPYAEGTLRDTLMHELWHAILYVNQADELLESQKEAEEFIATVSAGVWVGVLRENPVLVAYLTDSP